MVKKMETIVKFAEATKDISIGSKNSFIPPQFDGARLEAGLAKALRGESAEDFVAAVELLSLATYYEVKLPNLNKRQAFDKLEKVWPISHRPDLKDLWHFLSSKLERNSSAAAEHTQLYSMNIFSEDFKILIEKYSSMLKKA